MTETPPSTMPDRQQIRKTIECQVVPRMLATLRSKAVTSDEASASVSTTRTSSIPASTVDALVSKRSDLSIDSSASLTTSPNSNLNSNLNSNPGNRQSSQGIDNKNNTQPDGSALVSGHAIIEASVDSTAFTDHILDGNEFQAYRIISSLRKRGVSSGDILLYLVGPTAIELGRRWDRDSCNFSDVTTGVCRLQNLLRWLHVRHPFAAAHGGRVALSQVPGEQHSFGLLLIADALFQRGWYTDVNINTEHWRLPNLISTRHCDIIGFSISCSSNLETAKKAVAECRKVSCNPAVTILVGGGLVNDNPELVGELGADHSAIDAKACAALTDSYAASNTVRPASVLNQNHSCALQNQQ